MHMHPGGKACSEVINPVNSAVFVLDSSAKTASIAKNFRFAAGCVVGRTGRSGHDAVITPQLHAMVRPLGLGQMP